MGKVSRIKRLFRQGRLEGMEELQRTALRLKIRAQEGYGTPRDHKPLWGIGVWKDAKTGERLAKAYSLARGFRRLLWTLIKSP